MSSPSSAVFSSSSPGERSTTLRLRLGGVRAGPFSFAARPALRGSCRCFVRRSRSSSSVAVSSAPRSELSSTLCRGGDLALFGLEPDRAFILRRGVRQCTKNSPFTCRGYHRNDGQLGVVVSPCKLGTPANWQHLQMKRN